MNITRIVLLVAVILIPATAQAEELACSYSWDDDTKSHPMLIEVNNKIANIRGGSVNFKFRVVENSSTELIIIEPHTKASSGKDYPVGATIIVVDKQSNKLIRSNTYADPAFNKHGYGICQPIK